MVTQEEQEFLLQQQQQGAISDSQLIREQMAQSQQYSNMNQQEVTMASEQLDVEKELEKLTNLLKGKVPYTKDGEQRWADPKNNDEVLLSEEGINLITRTIRWYINKNTLLSNYEEELINHKMKDFSNSLADELFMNYEKYFLYPTDKECQDKLIERLKKKQESIISSAELKQEKYDREYIWKTLIDEIDPIKEKLKIKEQIVKNKLKGYDLLMRVVQDAVHSAYLRAWKGQERTTLRQHWHISESRNPNIPQQQSGGLFSFFRRR